MVGSRQSPRLRQQRDKVLREEDTAISSSSSSDSVSARTRSNSQVDSGSVGNNATMRVTPTAANLVSVERLEINRAGSAGGFLPPLANNEGKDARPHSGSRLERAGKKPRLNKIDQGIEAISLDDRLVIQPRPTSARERSYRERRVLFEQEEEKETDEPTAPLRGCGLCGLSNLGNTCYLNSVVQSLLQVASLEKFRNGAALKEGESELVTSTAELFASMWSAEEAAHIQPQKFKAAVGVRNPMFQGYNQHDAHEFLRCLLDGLHDDLNRVKGKIPYEEIKDIDGEAMDQTAERWWAHYERRNDSMVKDVFGGQLYSRVVCNKCGSESRAFDPVLDLSVPLPSGSSKCTLLDCLSAFTKREELAEYFCRRCNSQQASHRVMRIHKAPAVLVVHLKRFQQNGAVRKKLDTRVAVPRELDISPFMTDDSEPQRYELVSSVLHYGSLNGGHYTAAAKSLSNGAWYSFNDASVSRAKDYSDVVESDHAYLLTFHKVGTLRKKSNL